MINRFWKYIALIFLTITSTVLIPNSQAAAILSTTNTGSSLASIDSGTGTGTVIGSFGQTNCFSLAFDTNGTMFVGCNSGLYTGNSSTGQLTFVASLSPAPAYGLEVDSTGQLWMAYYSDLYKVNKTTGATTLIGTMTGTNSPMDMAFSSDGTLYLVDDDDKLFTINTSTAAATLIGAINVSDIMGIMFDSSGQLYATSFENPGNLYTINIATAGATLIGATGLSLPHGGSFLVPASQTITFGQAPSIVVGGTGTVSATATSGLPVTFSSQTPGMCTIAGATVTGVTSGTCTIAANQAGNANYAAAPQVTQDITVLPASQTITFGQAPSIVVGGTGTVSATATSGLPVTFSSQTPGMCTIAGATVTGVTSGTCTIAANQAGNANYAAAPQVTQNITVISIAPTITSVGPVTSGPTTGGTTVTITGTNFFIGNTGAARVNTAIPLAGSVTAVTFGGTAATSYTVNSTTQITAVTPPHAVGPVTVAVTTIGGTGTLSNGFTYELTPQAALVLTVNPITINVNNTGTLSTTGGSGTGVVTYIVTNGKCTISSNTLTGTTPGSCTVIATKAADSTYAATTSDPVTVTVVNTVPIPTLSEWAMLLLTGLLATFGWMKLPRRQG